MPDVSRLPMDASDRVLRAREAVRIVARVRDMRPRPCSSPPAIPCTRMVHSPFAAARRFAAIFGLRSIHRTAMIGPPHVGSSMSHSHDDRSVATSMFQSSRASIRSPVAPLASTGGTMLRQCCGIAALGLLVPLSAAAETRCEHLLKALAADLADATCVESPTSRPTIRTRRRRTIRSPDCRRSRSRRGPTATQFHHRRSPTRQSPSRSRYADRGAGRGRSARTGRASSCGFRTTGTASSSLPALRERAANSTAISRGATTSCSRVTRMHRRTRAC